MDKTKILAAVLLLSTAAAAFGTPYAAPYKFNYQGRLEDGGRPASGTKTFSFKLYDALSGGTLVWDSGALSITLSKTGSFAATLENGTPTLAPGVFIGDRWIEIAIDGTTLSPREPIISTPYSLAAQSLTESATAPFGLGIEDFDPAAKTNKLYNKNGTLYWSGSPVAGGVGDAVLAGTQTFTGQNTFDRMVTVSSTVKIIGGEPGIGKVLTSTDAAGNAIWVTPTTGGDVFLDASQEFSGVNTFSNSAIFKNNDSGIRIAQDSGINYIQSGGPGMTQNSKADLRFTSAYSASPSWLTIKSDSGNVGIGTDSPSSRLQVISSTLPAVSINTQGTFQYTGDYRSSINHNVSINPGSYGNLAGFLQLLNDGAGPGTGDHVGIGSLVLSHKGGGSTGNGDDWAYWGVVDNRGEYPSGPGPHESNGIVAEFNANNNYADWFDDLKPYGTGGVFHYMSGIQLVPQGRKHSTRAISIQQNPPNAGGAFGGWDTGIFVSGFVGAGLYINSDIQYKYTDSTASESARVGIRFGPDIPRLIGVADPGNILDDNFAMTQEGTSLLFRDVGVLSDRWWIRMDRSDSSVTFNTNKIKFTEAGDVAITIQGNGVILRATDGTNCYRITVNNAGTIGSALAACP